MQASATANCAQEEVRRLSQQHGIALIFDPAGSLAVAVGRLHKEAGLRDDLVAAAREFAERHLRERQADRLAAILASVAR